MIAVRARVRNGRLVVDEATDLPDGTEVDLIEDELASLFRNAPPSDEPLTDKDFERLKAIRAKGDYRSHESVRAKLAARKE